MNDRISSSSVINIIQKDLSNLLTSPGSLESPQDIAITPYLVKWSEIDHSAYCLALLFTYRDFSEGALGLAWVAEPELETPGGICSRKVLLEEENEALSFNTALATLLNYGVRLPRKASVITVLHELGHSFGSEVSRQRGGRGYSCSKKTRVLVVTFRD